MYIIAAVMIVGLTFYLAFFLNVTASAEMSSEHYLLFLNSLYLNRINYCTYLATGDSNYLFYMIRDMNVSSDPYIANYIGNCFSKVETHFDLLEGNYSTNSNEDLERLSEYICGYDDPNFESSIEEEYNNSIILIYEHLNISTVPIFAYLDIRSGNIGWILEPAEALLGYEIILNNSVNVSTFGIYIHIQDIEYYENQLIQNLENTTESFLSCNASKSYSILSAFALQDLVVDTNRNLYVLSVLQFSKTKNSRESVVIDNLTSGNISEVSESELESYCSGSVEVGGGVL